MHLTALTLTLLLAFTTALPQSTPAITVLLRSPENAYIPSPALAASISSAMAAADLTSSTSPLLKRAYAKVQACRTSSCSDCRVVWDGSFNSNSACIPADNTACLILTNLSGANVQFWNHAGCNGANTVFRGCGDGDHFRSAPGTNSLGVHTGC